MNFKEEKLHSEIYVNSPYVRGSVLWKQLPLRIQKANNKEEFNQLFTDDFLGNLL